VTAHVQELFVIEEPTDPRERLAREIARVHDRLRSMSADRLSLPIPGYVSRAAAAHATSRRLALLAQGVEQRMAEHPDYREVPATEPSAIGDQVAVCGRDLLLACEGVTDGTRSWIGLTSATVGDALSEGAEALRSLRLAL
jgi:hypothetical protein